MSRDRQILDAAAQLFYERGFHNVGVDDIGERVGVTGPAIYRHFSGKDHLLATLYHEALDELFLHIGGRQEDPHAELEDLIRAHAEFALAHRELLGTYTREDKSLADPWRKEVARRTNMHMNHWIGVLERCYPDRSTEEVTSAAFAAVGLLHSIAHWPRAALTTPDLAPLLVELVSEGLASLDATKRATAAARAGG